MKKILMVSVLVFGSLAMANGRQDCARNCAATLKGFEKQCKETARANPEGKAGCDMVSKQFEAQCKETCAAGPKSKKPTNTNSF